MEERVAFVKDWIRFRRKVQEIPARVGAARREIESLLPSVEASCDVVDWQEKMHYIDDASAPAPGCRPSR